MRAKNSVTAAVLVSAALLSGCGQAVEKAVETATGTDIDMTDDGITVSGEGGSVTVEPEGGNMTFTDEESGATYEAGTDVELPAGVPTDLPLPPSGSLMAASDDPSSGTIVLSWTWNDMTRSDVDAYIQALAAAGYVEQPDGLDQKMGEDGFSRVLNFIGDTHEVTLTAQASDGLGGIMIITTPLE